MADANKQKLKLLYLLRMLEQETDSQKGLTMTQIIEKLGEHGINAERKSIYRDIKVLRDFGYDIKMYQRAPVEYALESNELSLSEVTMLIDVVQSSKFLTERTSNSLVKALKGFVSERERKLLEKRVHVQGRIKSQNESAFYNVDTIHEALRQKKKITFLYYKFDTKMKPKLQHEGQMYELTPVKVVYADGFYYMVAWSDSHEDFSTYRIDRMRLLEISPEPATRNESIATYSFDQFEYQSFGMFNGEEVSVTLKVKPNGMDAIADNFGSDVDVLKSSDRQADVRVKVKVSPQFYGWVAGLNGLVKISEPKRIAAEYQGWLRSLIDD